MKQKRIFVAMLLMCYTKFLESKRALTADDELHDLPISDNKTAHEIKKKHEKSKLEFGSSWSEKQATTKSEIKIENDQTDIIFNKKGEINQKKENIESATEANKSHKDFVDVDPTEENKNKRLGESLNADNVAGADINNNKTTNAIKPEEHIDPDATTDFQTSKVDKCDSVGKGKLNSALQSEEKGKSEKDSQILKDSKINASTANILSQKEDKTMSPRRPTPLFNEKKQINIPLVTKAYMQNNESSKKPRIYTHISKIKVDHYDDKAKAFSALHEVDALPTSNAYDKSNIRKLVAKYQDNGYKNQDYEKIVAFLEKMRKKTTKKNMYL
ncbi:hypothetical protein EDEG_02897 [Edhazardia aedis USNM 41457]|uniref:Uncharacterized protein n=1 Tax=Edhazardia aedis (strain USNM 41457) TaxID=1003232 RepID=J8ZSS1_EDHAE|nr:hypothetical protein EDEG_02897 [Edhazardia aedis USNM 41457]|eukprot:EJW02713.1 hypothetical protein EDEG_02897 [Edhazardia aedis USNM 41457]